MKKTTTAIISFSLLLAPVCAFAADASPKAPTAEYGRPAVKASEGTCDGANSGDEKIGYVTSVGTSWFGTNNTTIAFQRYSSETTSIESSGLFTDSDEGIAQLDALMTAYLTGYPVTLYCMGRSPATHRYSFSSVWVGDIPAP
ncbi:hypothetical protein [Bordetella bronchialis]|uniref:Secreted protein n=1 Tax=Bordetella bronchialis TaxID=463025 RepID=A0A193FGP5_9BORD|nr:hypothetical protein [Bordetella bronchialis]ANN66810.1 hypothetical protein BAU06_11420 [Bordetella bronchialis]ANN71887.1 hypothetical protein BAU08_11620 [Bordetella bronchialis]